MDLGCNIIETLFTRVNDHLVTIILEPKLSSIVGNHRSWRRTIVFVENRGSARIDVRSQADFVGVILLRLSYKLNDDILIQKILINKIFFK